MLNNLDDFIAPSQACVNPIFSNSASAKGNEKEQNKEKSGFARIVIGADETIAPALVVQPDLIKTSTTKKAQVSLSDCLACSGCVTSAETVLVQNQSIEQFYKDVKSMKRITVVSVSPASLASVAYSLNIDISEAGHRITTYLKSVGVDVVVDCSVGSDIALLEACEEFMFRFQHGEKNAISTITKQNNTNDSLLRTNVKVQRFKRRRQNSKWKRPAVTIAQSATKVVDQQGQPVDLEAEKQR